jgi:hypothetical protein
MARLKFAVPLLCLVVLAAHFLREQNSALMLVSIAGIPFLFIRGHWMMRGVQLFFVIASIEWIHTAIVLMTERKALGLPWVRMAVILGIVAALTLASARIVRRKDLKQ